MAVGQVRQAARLVALLFKMSECLDMVEQAMISIAEDPERALDPELDIFAPVAAELPACAEWRAELRELTVTAADGKTEFKLVDEVLRRVRSPPPGSGEAQARPFMLKVLKAQAARALEKLHDKRLALSNKLTSQNGDYSFGNNADAHRRTIGVNGTNDTVENKFASADFYMRAFRGVSIVNVSGIVEHSGTPTTSTGPCSS